MNGTQTHFFPYILWPKVNNPVVYYSLQQEIPKHKVCPTLSRNFNLIITQAMPFPEPCNLRSIFMRKFSLNVMQQIIMALCLEGVMRNSGYCKPLIKPSDVQEINPSLPSTNHLNGHSAVIWT